MKTNHCVRLFAVVALLACVGFARAETLFSIDFETPPYAIGNLWEQDRWVQPRLTHYVNPQVGEGVGANTSQVMGSHLAGPTATTTAGSDYKFAAPFTFTSADTAVELYFKVYSARGAGGNQFSNAAIILGFPEVAVSDNYRVPAVGLYYKDYATHLPQTSIRSNPLVGSPTFGDVLAPAEWYEMKIVMDFSKNNTTPGHEAKFGKLDYYYRNLTQGETVDQFHLDGTIQNFDMYLVPNGNGEFVMSSFFAFVQVYNNYTQNAFLDDIRMVNTIPEPSALALSVCGLLGLLAYAWRRRK